MLHNEPGQLASCNPSGGAMVVNCTECLWISSRSGRLLFWQDWIISQIAFSCSRVINPILEKTRSCEGTKWNSENMASKSYSSAPTAEYLTVPAPCVAPWGPVWQLGKHGPAYLLLLLQRSLLPFLNSSGISLVSTLSTEENLVLRPCGSSGLSTQYKLSHCFLWQRQLGHRHHKISPNCPWNLEATVFRGLEFGSSQEILYFRSGCSSKFLKCFLTSTLSNHVLN